MTDSVRLGLALIGSALIVVGFGLAIGFVADATERRGLQGFRRLFLTAYAILAALLFLLTVQVYAYFGLPASTWPKKLMQGVSGAATFTAVVQPTVVRPCFHSYGRLTSLGWLVIRTFELSEDNLHRAISVPWKLSLALGLAVAAVNMMLAARR